MILPDPQLSSNYFNDKGSRSWSVEFAEVDALPCAEEEPALGENQRLGVTDRARFQVGGGVSFGVAILGVVPRVDFLKAAQHICFDIGIGILVDGDSGCRVERGDDDDSFLYIVVTQPFTDSVSDINHLIAGCCLQLKCGLHLLHPFSLLFLSLYLSKNSAG